MAKPKSGGLAAAVVAACGVAALWTVLTGSLWQWIPVLLACAVVYAVAKALKDHGVTK